MDFASFRMDFALFRMDFAYNFAFRIRISFPVFYCFGRAGAYRRILPEAVKRRVSPSQMVPYPIVESLLVLCGTFIACEPAALPGPAPYAVYCREDCREDCPEAPAALPGPAPYAVYRREDCREACREDCPQAPTCVRPVSWNM